MRPKHTVGHLAESTKRSNVALRVFGVVLRLLAGSPFVRQTRGETWYQYDRYRRRNCFKFSWWHEPFHSQEWSISNLPCSLTRNITLAFHRFLRWKIIMLLILTNSLIHIIFELRVKGGVNPFTPKSDQFQISPAASPEILHHTVWRTWLFTAYSDERWLHHQLSLLFLYISLEKVGRMYEFDLMGVKGLNNNEV